MQTSSDRKSKVGDYKLEVHFGMARTRKATWISFKLVTTPLQQVVMSRIVSALEIKSLGSAPNSSWCTSVSHPKNLLFHMEVKKDAIVCRLL